MATPAERLAEVNARISALKAKDIEGKRARLAEIDSRISELKGPKTVNSPPPTFAEEAVDTGLGAGETALSLLSGAVAEPIAGVAGLVSGASQLAPLARARQQADQLDARIFQQRLRGGDTTELEQQRAALEQQVEEGKNKALSRAARAVEGTRENLTYVPRTEAAQNVMGTIGKIAAPIERALDVGGEKVSEYTGSPLLGALTKAGVEIIPLGRFVPKSLGARAMRNQKVAEVKQEAAKWGVDLDAPIEEQKRQIVQAAVRETEGRFAIGSDLPQLQEAVIKAQRSAKEVGDALYAEARAKKANLPLKSLETFIPKLQRTLSSYDIEDMPLVKKRLTDLNNLYTSAVTGRKRTVDIRQLEMVRRRINSNQPSSVDKSQGAALNVLKGQLDQYMDDLFDAGMITGDKTAIQSWKNATSAWKDYSKRFNEDKFVKKLVKDKKATPEEIKNWLFGASSVGAKPAAGRTVIALRDSLTQKDPVTGKVLVDGNDTPQMDALRKEVLTDMMRPILGRDTLDSPRAASANFGQFVSNYYTMRKDNPTLAKELFDEETLKSLENLVKYSRTIALQAREAGKAVDASDAVAKVLFGHELAVGALKVDVARKFVRFLSKVSDPQARRLALSELSGYSLGAGDWLDIKPIQNQALIQSVIDQTDQEEQQKRQEALTKRPPGVQTRGTLAPGQGQPPAQPPPGAGAPPGGAPNSQSRMMLQSLFPQDATLQMPVPQPPPQPA
jgi:hypothetical protein